MTGEPTDDTNETNSSSRTVLHETEHDHGPVAESIIEALAEASDLDPKEMEPLYESINPDALENLFDRPSPTRTPNRVEFRHQGFDVVVEDGGRIAILDPI